MKLVKLFLVLLVAFIAVIGLTWTWFLRIAAGAAPGQAVDIVYVVMRPLYLLELLVIVALAIWVCWRWVFA